MVIILDKYLLPFIDKVTFKLLGDKAKLNKNAEFNPDELIEW